MAIPIVPKRTLWQALRGLAVLLLGVVAIAVPLLLEGSGALFVVGLLLVGSGVLEMAGVFDAADERARRSAFVGGALSLLAGLLLLATPRLTLKAMIGMLAVFFVLYGIVKVVLALWGRHAPAWGWTVLNGLFNVLLGVLIGNQWLFSGLTAVGVVVGIRMLGVGWALVFAPTRPDAEPAPAASAHPDGALGLGPHPELLKLQEAEVAAEESRRPIDAYWCFTFLLTFFAIHVGRMQAEWTLIGLASPGVAVVGDLLIGLLLAYLLVLPCRLAWRKLSRPLERRAWNWRLARSDAGRGGGLLGWPARRWLLHRYRFSLYMQRASQSPRAALSWGLQVGLPLVAVLVATAPIWGFSWYFNTENWVTGLWELWAEQRTDPWRVEIVQAVREHYEKQGVPAEDLFQVKPAGLEKAADFSFLVIGDPGEGDPSQHILRDRFLNLGERSDVRFLVVSSDVIYPQGAMKDYEPNFYLPFKGFTKPIYAVPGNHDWYDALEAFSANFLEADAARVGMHARRVADARLTSTTERRIAEKIDEAARLRREYGIPCGGQRAPYFEIQADQFALLVVDTGILRRIDADQEEWLRAALERARGQGKFIMAILGHPLYAGGAYQGAGVESLASLHRILRDAGARIVMGGDTHSLEYYRETYRAGDTDRTMHHFVNGGGGAYLSIGTPLDWPRRPPVPDCAFYPRTEAMTAKLDAETPFWKQPLWLWVKHLKAYPASVEGMASAFDFNRAPFFQSFMEVRVEGSANRVVLIPHGVHGPLRWRELQVHGHVIPDGKGEDDPAEFVVPMTVPRQ